MSSQKVLRPNPKEVEMEYTKQWQELTLLYYLRFDTFYAHMDAYYALRRLLFETAGDKSVEDRVKDYKFYLLQLYLVYTTYEEELSKNSTHKWIEPIYFPDELSRISCIEEDLEYFYGNGWQGMLETNVIPATTRFRERLREISATKPELLLAYAYTRSLGDLSNGNAIKESLKKFCKLSDNGGLRFYSYDKIPNHSEFRMMFANRMNKTYEEMGNFAEIEKQTDEANKCFLFILDIIKDIENK